MKLARKEDLPDLKKLIDSKLSPYDILRFYIGSEIKLNTPIRSPLSGHKHGDRSMSFSIGVSRGGHLHWKDHALDKSGGWSDLVSELYGLTYPQVLQKVCGDFGLLQDDNRYQKIVTAYKQPVIDPNHQTLIQVTAGKWSKKHLQYWEDYGINQEELQKEEIYPVKDLSLNRSKQWISPEERVFCYRYPGNKFKIYMVDRKKGEKWKMNVSNTYVENLENLNGSSKVLITKSKKDRIVLSRILSYTCLSVQNEGSSCFTEEFRKQLEGREVIIMYDNDPPGVTNCKKICDTWGYRYVNVPKPLLQEGIKDASDWYKARGNDDEIVNFLKQKKLL